MLLGQTRREFQPETSEETAILVICWKNQPHLPCLDGAEAGGWCECSAESLFFLLRMAVGWVRQHSLNEQPMRPTALSTWLSLQSGKKAIGENKPLPHAAVQVQRGLV